jgi:predicted kinase/TfoX/Sxy family transcriptional regulator of competence genes
MNFKYNDIIGTIIKRYPNGLVDIDYGGTIETMPESLNQINGSGNADVFEDGGMFVEEYPEIYEVRFTDKKTGEDYTDFTTKNKDEALSHKESLKLLGYKNPHIQHTFKNGGATMKAENGMKTPSKFEVGYRPGFLKGQVVLGKEITIKLPNGETPRGQFAIVELNDVLASHNEHTFSSTDGYPLDINGQNVNDRNYQQDQNAQAKVQEFAQDLQPDRLISTSRTPSGTPVISIDGVVISGNNRTMSIKLAEQQFPEKYAEYVDFLLEEIQAYGFYGAGRTKTGKGIYVNHAMGAKQFENPLLVRIDYDVKEYNTMELAKWNKDTKKSEKPIDKAIKLGKILLGSERCQNIISDVVGQYETFTEFYSNLADQKRIKDTLIDCNILTTQEIPAYFYERGFTDQGKELIENLLAGMVLSQEGLVASNEGGARAFRQTIITSLPVLTQNIALGDDSLKTELNEALLLQAKMTNNKLSFLDLIAQTNIFDEKPSKWGVYMNRLLASGRNKFKGAIEGYNASVLNSNEANLFGDKPTKEEIFDTYIASKIDPQERQAIEQSYPKEQSKPSEDEFRSAMQKSIETKLKSNDELLTYDQFCIKISGKKQTDKDDNGYLFWQDLYKKYTQTPTKYIDTDGTPLGTFDYNSRVDADFKNYPETYNLWSPYEIKVDVKKTQELLKFLKENIGKTFTFTAPMLNDGNPEFISLKTANGWGGFNKEGEDDWTDEDLRQKPTQYHIQIGYVSEDENPIHWKRKVPTGWWSIMYDTNGNLVDRHGEPHALELEQQANKTASQDEPIKNKTSKPMEKITTNPFVNGDFFAEHPEKVLATTEQGENWRTKAKITIYKGSISDVERIDADENFLTADLESDPNISVIKQSVKNATDVDTEVADNFKKAIDVSRTDETKKALRKVKKSKPILEQKEAKHDNEIVGLAENFTKLSPNVPMEDVMAFLIYQKERGREVTNTDWITMTGLNVDELYSSETKRKLVESGHLYYFNGNYLPSYLYFAENIYDKQMRLVPATENAQGSGQDKDYIIENYGNETYNNQVEKLAVAFKKQYEKRLLIKGDNKEGLMIVPISDFAKNFKIKTLENELPFKWKIVTAGSNKRYGQFDLLATNVTDYDKKEIDELSLKDAFAYWLRTDETIPFHKGVTYADIIGIYLWHKAKPRGEATPDKDGKYTGAMLILKKKEDAEWERIKSKAKTEGQRLFSIFLDTALTTKDKIRLEAQWNRDFNGYVPIDYNSVPVGFRSNRYFDGYPGDIELEKREAVAFTISEGSGLLAYDVGVGKTPSAIFTISQYIDFGWAKRPFLVVPNQTYKQWIAEFKKFAGHIKINEFYNCSSQYLEDFKRDGKTIMVDEGSISLFTYEGMKKLGFREETYDKMKNGLADILLQLDDSEMATLSNKKQDKEQEKLNSKVEKLIGSAVAKTVITCEDLGFDFVLFDEAHACKKVFTFVKGQAEESTSTSKDKADKGRATNEYEITSGTPSENGIKGFMLTYYIQNNFKGNTLLLTATPFTNSPLEIYSMLAMVAYNKLVENGMANLKTFFDTFVNVSYEMIINSKLKPQRKQVILGFNNLLPLQTLIRRFINYKSGDDVESVRKKRPNKIVLPLRYKMIDGTLMALNEDEKKDTILPFTPLQAEIMEKIKDYANGTIGEGELCSHGHLMDEDDSDDTTIGVELDEDSLDKSEKAGVRTLKALAHARNLALSPYIFECSGLEAPSYMDYIETSNKLKYVMECIRSIKKHHADHNQSMSGVIIYMDRGKTYFPLVKEYLVKELGFNSHEIGIMSSGIMEPAVKGINKEDQKEYIKNLFLGLKYNDLTQDVETISDEERVKVIIGSSMIREGINLQAHTSTLFNCWLDWNPSDQKQLYGRLFRQGNKFKTVRLVVPLMTDSIDIFMFEKLAQKTSRINSIWDTDGKSNAFDTTEFNPSELKRVLIKNPMIVAELELLEIAEKFEEEIADEKNVVKRLNKVEEYVATMKDYEEDLADWLEKYRPSNDKKRSVETNIALTLDVLRKQTDAKGKPMEDKYARVKHYEEIIKTDKDGKKYKEKGKEITDYYSDEPYKAVRQHYFNDLVIAVRGLKKETKEYLAPNGLQVKDIPSFIKRKEKEIVKMEEKKKKLTDEDAIKNRAKLIIEEREANNYHERPLQDVVDDFIELNDVLDEVKTPQITQQKAPVSSCPPVDDKGVVRIDAEALKMLDECNASLPQTKRMHSTEMPNGERVYTPERQKLHDEILKNVTKDAVCTDRVQPIAVLTGGGPGSGKSTFLRKFAPYLQSDQIIKVDADEIRAKLPEYKGWNSAQTHEETRDMVNELLNTFDQPCKHDILYDGTMSNAKKYLPLIDKLKALGYKVFVAFMDVPKEVSIQRALGRYQDNKGGTTQYGRYVPMEVIEDFFNTGKAGFENIKNAVDGYILVDSMTGKIIERGGEPIPQDRDYSVMFDEQNQKAVKPQAETTESEELFNFYVVGKGKNGFDESKDIEVVATSQADAMAKAKKLKPYTTFTSAKNMGKVQSAEPTKSDFEASLKGAKISVKYVTGEEKTEMQKYIKGLEITIKYM